MLTDAERLSHLHALLEAHYDLDRWHWRADTSALDICLGAILVQHTAWTNVEKALVNLREAGIDSVDGIAALSEEALALLVRPSGTPMPKARRLHALAALVLEYGGFAGLFDRPEAELRRLLLGTYGIGPETADVILLYAALKPAIVYDAYTNRLFRRIGMGPERDGYDTWRAWLDERLPQDVAYRKRHHAAIVVHCKELCRVKPRCEACPLRSECAYAGVLAS
jgi:endonuclease-3 related protein